MKKIKRRNPEQMEGLLEAIRVILDSTESQVTIRHLFYRLVSAGEIEKTEHAYKNLNQHLTKWRRSGDINWGDFSDSTRWYLRAPVYSGIRDVLDRTQESYRRDMWASQPYYVEVWVEKDAIAGLISETAQGYGVPTFVCRGFSSLTGIYQASETFHDVNGNGKTPIVFHLGDYDPSGQAGAAFIERSLREDFECDVDFRSIAVTREQIAQFDLPTRPTKTSSHSVRWTGGESVELDAMSTEQIQGIVENAITDLIDPTTWNRLRLVEEEERKTLKRIASRFRNRRAA